MITEKQEQVLRAISNFIIKNKYSPTVRELALMLNLKSTSTVQGYLDRLQTKGYIARDKSKVRTIHIL